MDSTDHGKKSKKKKKKISVTSNTGHGGRIRRHGVTSVQIRSLKRKKTLLELVELGNVNYMSERLRDDDVLAEAVTTTETLLPRACEKGLLDMAALLLRYKVPLDVLGEKEMAPLHIAVKRGHIAIVALLISRGANVNIRTRSERRSPLHLAAIMGQENVAILLLQNEADIDQGDIYGTRPLHMACQLGRTSMASLLLKHTADVNAYDNEGWTGLHLAAEAGQINIVHLMVANNAHIDQQNRYGRTALHWAVKGGQVPAVRYLLEAGSNTLISDLHEKTALSYCSSSPIRKLLEYHTKDCRRRNSDPLADVPLEGKCIVGRLMNIRGSLPSDSLPECANSDSSESLRRGTFHISNSTCSFSTIYKETGDDDDDDNNNDDNQASRDFKPISNGDGETNICRSLENIHKLQPDSPDITKRHITSSYSPDITKRHDTSSLCDFLPESLEGSGSHPSSINDVASTISDISISRSASEFSIGLPKRRDERGGSLATASLGTGSFTVTLSRADTSDTESTQPSLGEHAHGMVTSSEVSFTASQNSCSLDLGQDGEINPLLRMNINVMQKIKTAEANVDKIVSNIARILRSDAAVTRQSLTQLQKLGTDTKIAFLGVEHTFESELNRVADIFRARKSLSVTTTRGSLPVVVYCHFLLAAGRHIGTIPDDWQAVRDKLSEKLNKADQTAGCHQLSTNSAVICGPYEVLFRLFEVAAQLKVPPIKYTLEFLEKCRLADISREDILQEFVKDVQIKGNATVAL